MPYIKQTDRIPVEQDIQELDESLTTRGEYNYVISKLIHGFIEKNGLSYSTLNDAVGILECAKQELLRTVVAPYEDAKRVENGSVSVLDRVRK